MGKSIGIDLGTTNSVMCVMHTETEIVLNRENGRLTPSAVAYRRSKKTGDQIIVGKLAADYAKLARKDYLYSVKRLMGRPFDDEEVRKITALVSYEVAASPDGPEDEVRVKLGGKLYEPKEISSMILKKLKEDAELRLGDTVDSAVITVPAYFSERQKNATREAGLLAGLRVKKVIDEPTAAAIAYGVDQQDDQDRMVLVFDLGGGTFDVSILLMVGGIFSQMDNEGDMWLGGDDFDRLIMGQVIELVEKEEGLTNLAANDEFMQDLRRKAREAKEVLSSQESAEIIITDSLKDEDGLPLPVEFEITRPEFEALLEPHVQKARECVTRAMDEANLDKEDIDAVLMVGGSSTIPVFQNSMEEFFGKERVLRGIDPMTCVAQGAAILAKSLGGVFCQCGQENPLEAEVCQKCGADLVSVKEKAAEAAADVPETMMVEAYSRTPKHYGIEIEGGVFEVIIPKNTIYPTEEPSLKHFKTTMTGQRLVKLPVYEGEDDAADLSGKAFQGNIWFYDLPPNLPEGQVVEISMDLDSDMVFTVGCRIRGMDWSRQIKLIREKWKNDVLDEAMHAHVEIQQQGLTGSVAEKMLDDIKGIGEALEGSNEAKAREHMNELKRMKEEQAAATRAAQAGVVDWRLTIQNVLSLGQANFDPIKSLLPPNDPKAAAYEGWAKAARAALEAGDEIRGKLLAEEGLAKLLEVGLVGDLAVAQILINHPEVDPSISARLDQARNQVFAAIQRRDGGAINSTVGNFRTVLQEALDQLQKAGVAAPEIKVLLGRA